MTATFDRVLPTHGIHNFRDFGGYAAAGGGRVVTGKLFRSAQHMGATDEDLAHVAALDLAVVVDLRGARERQAAPCPRPATFGARLIATDQETASVAPHLEAAKGSTDPDAMHQRMLMVYDDIAFRPSLNALLAHYFAALAEDETPTLIHCLAGKDRTGIAVAFTHKLLGVHDDDVIADYLLTNSVGNVEARIAAGAVSVRKSTGRDVSDAAMRVLMSVHPDYLQRTFRALDARHGGFDPYMREVLGVDAVRREAIRARLLV